MKSIQLIALFILFSFVAQAQYVFENKKVEKLYNKLDDAYYDYEYETILDNEQSINEFFIAKQDTMTARMYAFLGEAYEYEVGDLNKALDFYTNEYRIRKELTPDDAGDVLFNVASLSYELGRTREAEVLYLELAAGDLEKYGKNDATYWDSEISLLDFYSFSNQPSKGLETARRLRKTFPKNSAENAIRLKSEGDFREMIGEYSKSERVLKQAINILSDLDMYASDENIATLSSLATLYERTGKLPQAEELYLDAQSILDRLEGDNSDIQGGITNNLAWLYYKLGNYEKAEELYTQLLADDLEYFGEESANYGQTALNFGLNQMYASKYGEAKKYLKLAKEVFDVATEPNDPVNAYVLNNLIVLNLRIGEADQAMEIGKQALAKYQEVFDDDYMETAWPYFNLGNVYMSVGELDKAAEYHQKALGIRLKRGGKKHPVYARSTQQMAILEWKKGNMEKALEYFDETFENYFNQINTYFPILSEEEKSKFYYNKLKPTVEQFNSFVIKAASDDRSLQGKMYDYQLTLKGIILSANKKVKQAILSSGDSVLVGKYEAWLGQKEQLAQLFSDGNMDESARNQKIDSLTLSSDNLEKELSKISAGFSKTIEGKKPTWQDIKGKLKPGEAAVEVVRFRDFATDSAGIFTDEVYYAALIVRHDTEDYPEMVLLRNGKQMETKFLSNYRNAIKYKINESRSYTLYWRPIANRLKDVNQVYFSPDGVYNQISINTLLNPQTKQFTLDELNIHLVSNTKDLLSVSAPSNNKGASIFFGYPNYNLGAVETEESREAGTASEAAGIAKAASENRGRGTARGGRGGRGGGKEELDLTQVSIPRGLRGNMLRYMRSNSLLALLPGTKVEVELIDSLHGALNAEKKLYLSNEALEEAIKEIKNPKTLHIATHGFFLEDTGEQVGSGDGYVENPLLRSGLILAGANSFIRTGEIGSDLELVDDGILTAYEAMSLPLDDTELVVLSACETGLGEVKNGEGVFGLQRAFQVAGAKAIIMSMWTVDDAATQELMTNFYEEWLTSGDKHAAFIKAQKTLKDKWKKPYYWGAFVIVGN